MGSSSNTFLSTMTMLHHLELYTFLDKQTVKTLSLVSPSVHLMVRDHICKDMVVTLSTSNKLSHYKEARRIKFRGCNIHYSSTTTRKVTSENIDGLPESITHILFGTGFNQPLGKHLLPYTCLTHITFGISYNLPINADELPSTITHLTFGSLFNQPVNNLPSSLEHLSFGSFFNQPVDNLPSSLTHLTFGCNFNGNVDNLPHSIQRITFGQKFNQPVDMLPPNVTHITFGLMFNQNVDHLPPSVTHLVFGTNFLKSTTNLPRSVTHLTLNYRYLHFYHSSAIPLCIKNLFVKHQRNTEKLSRSE
jgi:hypothetical protein